MCSTFSWRCILCVFGKQYHDVYNLLLSVYIKRVCVCVCVYIYICIGIMYVYM